MAAKKNRGLISHNFKKYINGEVVKPTMYYNGNTSGRLVGVVGDEMIRDANGKPIPFHNIVADWR